MALEIFKRVMKIVRILSYCQRNSLFRSQSINNQNHTSEDMTVDRYCVIFVLS